MDLFTQIGLHYVIPEPSLAKITQKIVSQFAIANRKPLWNFGFFILGLYYE